MEIIDRFRFRDILAFLLPGVIGTIALYLLLLVPSFNLAISTLTLDWSTLFGLLVFSFAFGVLLSGIPSFLTVTILRVFIPNWKG